MLQLQQNKNYSSANYLRNSFVDHGNVRKIRIATIAARMGTPAKNGLIIAHKGTLIGRTQRGRTLQKGEFLPSKRLL